MRQYSFLLELSDQWKRALHGSAIGGLAGGGIGAAGRVGYNLIKGNKWDDSLDKYTIAGAGLGAAAGGMHGYFKNPVMKKAAGKAKQQTAQQTGQKATETAVDAATEKAGQGTKNLSPIEIRRLNSNRYQKIISDTNKEFEGHGLPIRMTNLGKMVIDPKAINEMPREGVISAFNAIAKNPRQFKRLDKTSLDLLRARGAQFGLYMR